MESSNLDPEFYGSEDVLPQSPPLVAIEPEKLTYTPETVIPPSELCLALDVGVDTGLTPFVSYFNGNLRVFSQETRLGPIKEQPNHRITGGLMRWMACCFHI